MYTSSTGMEGLKSLRAGLNRCPPHMTDDLNIRGALRGGLNAPGAPKDPDPNRGQLSWNGTFERKAMDSRASARRKHRS